MRPHHLPVRARAVAIADHRHEAMLGAVALALALATAFAVLAAGWQLGGVALNMLGMTS